ncbi:histone-lysine N-methyltransferase ASHH2 isoform X1 [Sesamum indicum]|uniref:Histone-lysine N-methyltransferase ASHH2 isoform X1 n=1 Tax=Sesamum indicum TaxID=4182 RepID=A0A6I9SVT0_SESIN|nr:histone-lysine N-methyltransferase ASHH2 isoform X1 [Sesamum indicum]
MFAETSSGENAGEIKEESFVVDPDFDIGKMSVSPVPYESLCLEPVESSSKMVLSDVLDADVLLSAFDSFSFADLPQQRNEIAKNSIETDAVGSICDADPPGQIAEEGKDTCKFDSSDCDGITEPSSHENCGTGVVDEIDKAQEPHHPLIVYTSSRRKSVRNTITKLNQNNESRKPSRNCRRITKKNSALDLNSLQISRRKRSLFSKPARSSVWGYLGSILPAFEEHNGLDLNLDKKKLKGARGGQGKRNAIRDQTGRKSVRKSCTPTGHISLKIKIGNQSCGMVNFNAPGNSNHGLPDTLESKFGEEVPGGMVLPHERNLEKMASSDTSILGSHIDVNGIVENSSTSGDVHQISSQEEGDNLGPSTENRCSDPGTSPDSEVINSVSDAPLFEKGLQNMQDSLIMPMEMRNEECFTSTVPDVSFGNVSSLSFPRMKSKKGKKKDKHDQLGDCSLESQQTGVETRRNAKAPAELGSGQEVVGVSYCHDASMSATVKPKGVSNDTLCCSSMADPGTPFITAKGCAGAEMNPSPGLVAAIESDSQAGDKLIPFKNRQKFPKSSKAMGRHAGRCGVLDLPRKKDKTFRKKGDKNNLVGEHQIAEKGGGSGALGGAESHLTEGNEASYDLGETGDLSKDLSGPAISFEFPSGGQRDQYVPPRNAWVLCDDCQKWRRIPATLADQIEETNCGWTCKDNMDKDFADCSIPQEKSNSEINEELEISDASCEEDACDALLKSSPDQSKVAQQSSWSLIKSNLFLHRSRKNQTIDEVMVCHCKPPADGRMGCGAKCLNRMLNIECVQGTCPCGEFCSNQQFQKRKYAKLKWFRCGKKGFGLQALDNISEGQFLIEYVGEVLDMHAYQKRQREYALQGHRHFYFMTLNGSEVIDASAKGNLGRFINHSCDPNCRTEKWMVNGEVCVGLFALRDIKKGEEVTFDYNYVRVFGAAAKKCVCGSPNCRGYIGGDPTNSEVIVQDDSDDEYAEPVMICEDREMNGDWNDIMSISLHDGENGSPNEPPQSIHGIKKLVNAASQFESTTSETLIQKAGVNSASTDGRFKTSTATAVEDMMVQDIYDPDISVGNSATSNAAFRPLDANRDAGECLNTSASAPCKVESQGALPVMDCPVQLIDVSFQSEGSTNKAMPSAFRSAHGSDITTTVAPSKSQPDTVESKRKLKSGTLGGKEEIAKSDSIAKARHSSSSIKKGKLKSIVNSKGTQDMDKSNAASAKPKKLPDLSLNSQVEAVEDKLNELLDTEGGISKRKDASRGYLKLLFLTAASGANGHGEAIQSNRDLSMILDALLKTKSRTVLVDIINKNGLQMLHNIMKRYRKEFIKTPILRKLLKVLEYLAMREILTLEHITGGPPCPGVESFKDSILTLTEHVDKQVHQIARNFRDRWIPRSHRKSCFAETDDWKTEFHQRLSHGRSSLSYDHWNDRAGKPAEATECFNTQKIAPGTAEASTLDHLFASGSSSGTNGTRTRKRKSRWDNPAEEHLHPKIMSNLLGDGKPNNDEDIPPGFSPPCIDSMVPANVSSAAPTHQERDTSINHPFDVVLGDSQQRFIARMPVSYGVPSSVMQQFGVRQAETAEVWTVAPGLPFHPFPPLPPYARNTGDPPTVAAKCASLSEPAEKSEQVTCNSVTHHSGQKHMTTHSVDPPEINISFANDRPEFQREGGSSLGRKYFRQQKWNPSKLVPPWVRMRNSWGYGGNTRNGVPGVCSGNGANQFRNSYNSEEFNWRGEF